LPFGAEWTPDDEPDHEAQDAGHDGVTPTEIAVLSFVSFVVGLWAGHRFSLWRDKRKESIDAIAPVRAELLKGRRPPTPHNWFPGPAEIDLIEHYLGPIRRMRFRTAVRRYKQCAADQQRQDDTGSHYYENPEAVAEAIDDVLVHLRLR
jgi:hypothetical protein